MKKSLTLVIFAFLIFSCYQNPQGQYIIKRIYGQNKKGEMIVPGNADRFVGKIIYVDKNYLKFDETIDNEFQYNLDQEWTSQKFVSYTFGLDFIGIRFEDVFDDKKINKAMVYNVESKIIGNTELFVTNNKIAFQYYKNLLYNEDIQYSFLVAEKSE